MEELKLKIDFFKTEKTNLDLEGRAIEASEKIHFLKKTNKDYITFENEE